MIPGTKVNVLGKDYIVPPFNIRMWERPELNQDAQENETPSSMLKRIGPVLIENLARNYPDVDQKAMLDDLDLPTYLELRNAGMAVRHDPANPTSEPAASQIGPG